MSIVPLVQIVSLRQLFGAQSTYKIPIYQRVYAWGPDEVITLLRDFCLAAKKEKTTYYIGSIVLKRKPAEHEPAVFSVVDGQQRLTTLHLLMQVLKVPEALAENWKLKIGYEARKGAAEIFANLDAPEPPDRMKDAVNIMRKFLDEAGDTQLFTRFLLDNVKIVLNELPSNTQDCHYFEVMNTRGEQLEQHEVLKARLMRPLQDSERQLFAALWDACAQIDYCVVNSADTALPPWLDKDFAYLLDQCPEKTFLQPKDNESRGLRPIINFPSLLLQVLALMNRQEGAAGEGVLLDERKLLDTFDRFLPEPRAESRTFIFELFRARFLLDRYIVKRDMKGGDLELPFVQGDFEQWNRLRLLQAAFHVSWPGQDHKYWLLGALGYLRNTASGVPKTVEPKAFRDFLEKMAAHFLMRNHLSETRHEYGAIVSDLLYGEGGGDLYIPDTGELNKRLEYGKPANRAFVFNYLDYLLFFAPRRDGENKGVYSDREFKKFRFISGDSVEHFQPRTPEQPHQSKGSDGFGNLCLLPRSLNSSVSNAEPGAKREMLEERHMNPGWPSLKLRAMCLELKRKNKSTWHEADFKSHEDEMLQLLITNLRSSTGG